jgi:hypothetical protein
MGRAIYKYNPSTEKFEEVYNSEDRFISPAIRFDEIAPVAHPATGRIFTSRAKFDEETFRSGCVPVHGNDKPRKHWESNAAKEEREHKEFSDAYDRAYNDLDNNNVPKLRMSDEAKALWKRINGNDIR